MLWYCSRMPVTDNFWTALPRPFFALAPMEDVTDAAFRRLIARYGKPHVMFTEFTSADGLVLAPESGQAHLRKKLLYSDAERPIVAQLFSAYPDRMERAAGIIAEMGFDGIDINMGCPDVSVEKGGAGAALIKNPALARELMLAARRGAPILPLSIKTRIGYARDEIGTWIPELLAEHPAALIIHLRTRNEMSDVSAHWDLMPRIVALRDTLSPETLIIGNGDVRDLADARAKASSPPAGGGCDGVMLGRAIYGNPRLFAEHVPTPRERVEALIEHLRLFDELLADIVNYATMKKHFKAYISGWNGAKELRMRLMETESAEEAVKALNQSAA